MKLIIGGAFQGKKAYALSQYPGMPLEEALHLTILEWVKQDKDVMKCLHEKRESYRDKIILCQDISCGVVPVDPLMRRWREEVGRALIFLAGECDEVVRIFCGLGTRIK